MKYIASISFGKDSLAMLIRLLEENKQLDAVVFFDTGMEFGCIYQLMKRCQKILNEKSIPFVRLKAKKEFLYLMLDYEVHHKNGTTSCGYKWCGGKCRWFTSYKTSTINQYLKENFEDYKEYVGIAYDEPNRIKQDDKKIYPLVKWKMTEKECLDYCHSKGWYWYEGEHELYDHLDRVSCWCCRNKNLKELKQIYKYFKPYWFALCELERRCQMNMKNKNLIELEKQFEKENLYERIL